MNTPEAAANARARARAAGALAQLSRRLRLRSFNESAMTTKIEVTKIEEQAKGRLLFNVRATSAERRIDFPIGIQGLASPVLDEAAVLRSTLAFAEELAASVRLRLTAQTPAPQGLP
jgi:hypothetical protein